MLLTIILITFANLIFLYIFWSRLKEDYQSQDIFTTAFYILLAATITYQIARRISPTFWFWAVILGVLAGFGIGLLRFGFKPTETLDALVIALLPVNAIIFLGDYLKVKTASSLIAFIVILSLMVLYFVFNAQYKKFTWYRSGRIGFSGIAVLGLYFLIRFLFASFNFFVVSFSGKHEVYLSAVFAFVSFLTLFNLARKKA